jgi:DNA-binding transcriptional regulator YdaS (Cro superfamily)
MEKLTTWIKAERGRLADLAGACGITHAAILQWKRIPSDHVLTIEKATGIPRKELRPDLYEGMESAA